MTDRQAQNSALDLIESVLTKEKRCLLSGRLQEISTLMDEKLQAMEVLDALLREGAAQLRAETTRKRLSHIVRLASENAQHFLAVQNGLRSLSGRVSGTTENAYVGAYQSNGLNTPFTKAAGNYLRKV